MTIFELMMQPPSEEKANRVLALHQQLLEENSISEARQLARVFHLDFPPPLAQEQAALTTITIATAPIMVAATSQIPLETFAPGPEPKPEPEPATPTPSFREQVLARLNRRGWSDYPPTTDSTGQDKEGWHYFKLRESLVSTVVPELHAAGLLVELYGRAVWSDYDSYQTFRVKLSVSLSVWFEAQKSRTSSSSNRKLVVDCTGWSKEQLARIEVLGWYGHTTRLVVRMSSAAAAYDGRYYFVRFEREGHRKTKVREQAFKESDPTLQFGKVNPYAAFAESRAFRIGDEAEYQRLQQLNSKLRDEGLTAQFRRYRLFDHLLAPARHKRQSTWSKTHRRQASAQGRLYVGASQRIS